MIERQIIASNVKELEIQEYITKSLKNLGQSHIKLQKTPLGEKIIIYASRPGLIVGRKGQNIKKLTEDLKANFKLDNPQIEINEVSLPDLDAQIVAERVAGSLEKFGTQRFKGVGHRVMGDVMNSGALGVEILITGKIPSSRAKRWRFSQGYLKKCGDVAIVGVKKAYTSAQLKTGSVGIQVRIMPPDIELPDYVKIEDDQSKTSEDMKEEMGKPAGKQSKQKKKPEEKKEKTSPKKTKQSAKPSTKSSSKGAGTKKTAEQKKSGKQEGSTEDTSENASENAKAAAKEDTTETAQEDKQEGIKETPKPEDEKDKQQGKEAEGKPEQKSGDDPAAEEKAPKNE